MSKIFIYGVPGVGKTHYAKWMASRQSCQAFELDKIKHELRSGKKRQDFPFLFLGTCQAYKQFGSLNYEHAVKGLLAVRHALRDAVEAEIERHDEGIFEGAFLDPQTLQKHGRVILLTATNENHHKKQFLSHWEKWLDFRGEEFQSARLVQQYLIEEARQLGVEIRDG